MQRFVLSTDDIPERDRFSYWLEHVNQELIGVTGELPREEQASFVGRIAGSMGSSLVHFRYRAHGYPGFRHSREIARRTWADWLCLYQETGDGAQFTHDGREHETRRGDLIIPDSSARFTIRPAGGYDMKLWFFPRALVEPHLSARSARALQISAREGIGGILVSYLDGISEQVAKLGEAEAGTVANNFCRLLAVAWGGEAGEHRDAFRAARLEEAKRHIARHLSEAALSPQQVAAALKISVRQLHALFEPTGTSFAQYVLRRRLEECRAALTSPAGAGRSVTDIAYAWGFNSLATFFRTFRQAYGVTPNELRSTMSRER